MSFNLRLQIFTGLEFQWQRVLVDGSQVKGFLPSRANPKRTRCGAEPASTGLVRKNQRGGGRAGQGARFVNNQLMNRIRIFCFDNRVAD